MKIKYDLHLHSDFSGDSNTPAEKMAARAAALGLDGMCFTEHVDPDYPKTEDEMDFSLDYEMYFKKMEELRRTYSGKMRIMAGMEFGIQAHLADTLSALSRQKPFDFIIASQHVLNDMDPYYPSYFEGRTEEECYREFLKAQLENIKKLPRDSFDTLGHMDYIVRYGPNRNLFYSYARYADCIDPVLGYLIENEKCLEVNTGGLKYGLGQSHPCVDVLRRYRELGGYLITVGSDAHTPEYLCHEFDRIADLLRELGFRSYSVFEKRQPRQIML